MKALSTIVMRTEFLRSIGTQPDALGATLAHGTRGCQATTVPRQAVALSRTGPADMCHTRGTRCGGSSASRAHGLTVSRSGSARTGGA